MTVNELKQANKLHEYYSKLLSGRDMVKSKIGLDTINSEKIRYLCDWHIHSVIGLSKKVDDAVLELINNEIKKISSELKDIGVDVNG